MNMKNQLTYISLLIMLVISMGSGPATKPTTVPCKFVQKEYQEATTFSDAAITLLFDNTSNLKEVSGTIVIRDEKGDILAKVNIKQDVEAMPQFAVMINYTKDLKWLKDLKPDKMNVTIEK